MSALVCLPHAQQERVGFKTDSIFRRFLQEASEVIDAPDSNLENKINLGEIIANFALLAHFTKHAVENHICIDDTTIKSIQEKMEFVSSIIDSKIQKKNCTSELQHLKDIYAQLSISMCTILIQKDETLRSLFISGNQDA